MSLSMLQKVFDMTTKTTPLQRLVLLALADCHNEQNDKCYPSYETLARMTGADKRSVARTINELETKGLISRNKFRKPNGIGWEYSVNIPQTVDVTTVDVTTIDVASIDKASTVPLTRRQLYRGRGVNRTGIQREYNKKKEVCFVKPTADEVRTYCTAQGITNVDADQFMDYYEGNGWMVGKSKMKNWQATVRNWSRRHSQSFGRKVAPVGLMFKNSNKENYDEEL